MKGDKQWINQIASPREINQEELTATRYWLIMEVRMNLPLWTE